MTISIQNFYFYLDFSQETRYILFYIVAYWIYPIHLSVLLLLFLSTIAEVLCVGNSKKDSPEKNYIIRDGVKLGKLRMRNKIAGKFATAFTLSWSLPVFITPCDDSSEKFVYVVTVWILLLLYLQ